MDLIHYRNNGWQIGSGIWCGIPFVIAGGLTLSPGSSSVTTLRKVMLIISIIFASFFTFYAFIAATIHAFADAWNNNNQYSENRWLRVTQGFCAIFEIILASLTLCQRTSEGQVIATPQTLVFSQPVAQPIYQPAVQMGYQPAYQPQVQTGFQPGVQPQFQAQAYPQTAPPPYTG